MDDNLTIEYHENLSQDRDVALLSEHFAETITVSQEDDVEPVVPTEQSSFPAEKNTEGKLVIPNVNSAVTEDTDGEIECDIKENCLVTVRFSTIVCTGLEKSGKTSFCEILLPKKTVPLTASGDSHTVFIKNSIASLKEGKWAELNLKEINELINMLNGYQKSPNSDEVLEMLLLLDTNVPTPALCLLQHSLVTFVTYKMIGKNCESDMEKFIKQQYSGFVKELLSSNCTGKKSNSNDRSCTAFLGIHNGSCDETAYGQEAKVVNNCLNTLKQSLNCPDTSFPFSIWYIEPEDNNEYLHLVNLENHKDGHFEKVKSTLEKIIDNDCDCKVPVPRHWLLLRLNIQKHCIENSTYFMEYNVVYEKIWKVECRSSDKSDLKHALSFFHDVGNLFYYDTVKGINDFVFTDCTWIFDTLRDLYNPKDSTYQCDHSATLSLKYEGILMSSMIKKIKCDHLMNVKFEYFIYLLEHLSFVAKLNDGNYFIPSILDSYEDKDDVFSHYGTMKFQPLLITFSSGSLHRNIFCFLAANLLNTLDDWSKLQYNARKSRQHTFKDLITFAVNLNSCVCHVCILDKTFFLEIRIYTKSEDDNPTDLHQNIYINIEKSLKAVCAQLNLSYKDCKYGFFCCLCETTPDHEQHFKQHLMIITKKVDKKISVRCGKSGDFDVLKDQRYTIWFYEQVSNIPVHGQATNESEIVDGNEVLDMRKAPVFSQEVGRNPTSMQTVVGHIVTHSQQQSSLIDPPCLRVFNHQFRNHFSHKWFDLGIQLNVPVGVLQAIENNHNTDEQRCSSMFQKWIERNTSPSWECLIEALRDIEMNNVADVVSRAYYGTSCHTPVNACSQGCSRLSHTDKNQRYLSTPVCDNDKRNYYHEASTIQRNSATVQPDTAFTAPAFDFGHFEEFARQRCSPTVGQDTALYYDNDYSGGYAKQRYPATIGPKSHLQYYTPVHGNLRNYPRSMGMAQEMSQMTMRYSTPNHNYPTPQGQATEGVRRRLDNEKEFEN